MGKFLDVKDMSGQDKYLAKLKSAFGFNGFRSGQWQIIRELLESGRDVCGILATGAGKSLCYQFPAVWTGKTSLVVSPLISLMEDQKLALLAKGITCEVLCSTTSSYVSAVSRVLAGRYSVVYTTPEFLAGNTGLVGNMAQSGVLGLIAIDEAHCISQWGHDFRPSYRQLRVLRDGLGGGGSGGRGSGGGGSGGGKLGGGGLESVPILALTATATPTIVDDMVESIGLRDVAIVKTSFYRRNLSLWVRKKGSNRTYLEMREVLGPASKYGGRERGRERGLNDGANDPKDGENGVSTKKSSVSGQGLVDDDDDLTIRLVGDSSSSSEYGDGFLLTSDDDEIFVKPKESSKFDGDLKETGFEEDDVKEEDGVKGEDGKGGGLTFKKPVVAGPGRGDSVIIYAQSRKETEAIYSVLSKYGYPCACYHAGMTLKKRTKVHEDFIYDRVPIVVATIAFGMGIDKPSIRLIINWGLPGNIETFYQEIGRAGRDGLPSECYLFYNYGDMAIQKFLIQKQGGGSGGRSGLGMNHAKIQAHYLRLLDLMYQWAESPVCRQYQLNRYFERENLALGSVPPSELSDPDRGICGLCDNCQSAADEFLASGGGGGGLGGGVGDLVDVGADADLLVGLVRGLRCNYGWTNLVGILTGSKAKSFPTKLQKVSWYGKGDYQTQAYWKALGALLVDHGYLEMETIQGSARPRSRFGGGGSSGFQVVCPGSKKLELDPDDGSLMVNPNAALRKCLKVRSKGERSGVVSVQNTDLMDRLKSFRRVTSTKMRVPPYLVLSDPVIHLLMQLVARVGVNGGGEGGGGVSMDDLKDVEGINTQMLSEYGEQLLDVLNAF